MHKINRTDSLLIGEIVAVALSALRANKLRSFLTMLGVVIGVGAVIAVVALGRGAQQSVNARIASLGTTLLSIFPADIRQGGVASGSDRAVMLIKDALALDKTRSQVFEIGPLGLMQVTRKRVSGGLVESFSETCPTCEGRGILINYEV